MKRILLIIILLGVLYYIAGFISVQIGWLNSNTYNSWSTIVGGIATLSGLIAFVMPKFTPTDLEMLDIKSLQKITKMAEELDSKKTELNVKATEITKLEQQKSEMEFLVRKASLSLFLQDQIERSENRVLELLNQNENKEILRLLDEIKITNTKLSTLEEEIQNSEQVELLEEIIGRANKKKQDTDDIRILIRSTPFPFRSIIEHANTLLRILRNRL